MKSVPAPVLISSLSCPLCPPPSPLTLPPLSSSSSSQPSFQQCWSPSLSFWSFFRRRHLLHPSGIPAFDASDLTVRRTKPLPDAVLAAVPRDWSVVYLRRVGHRELTQSKEVLALLRDMFGEERVRIVKGGGGFKRGESLEVMLAALAACGKKSILRTVCHKQA